LNGHLRTLVGWARILGSSKQMVEFLGRTLRDGRCLAESLGLVLADFARYRNPAVHESVAGRADAVRWRQRILGIGCEGALARMAGAGAVRD